MNVQLDTDVTTTEIHAAVLGLAGAVPGTMLAVGQREAALAIAAPAVAVALGFKKFVGEDSKAEKMIRREPWYFLFVFVLSAVLAAVAQGGP